MTTRIIYPSSHNNKRLMMEVTQNIINLFKTDYETPTLFLGERMGLFDTVNKHFPWMKEYYKKQKKQDWDELEQPLATCNTEFKTCHKNEYEMMKYTLAWQWEGDTEASRSLFAATTPFISSESLSRVWRIIEDNETVHAATYSEIVRNSFDNPSTIIKEILSIKESLKRLELVDRIFHQTHIIGHKLALNMIDRKDPLAYDTIFLFIIAMYCLERIQFMASFAITFTMAHSGRFLPIGKSVQKIAKDEIEIHIPFNKRVLLYELSTERGRETLNRLFPIVENLVNSIIDSEITYIKFLFSNGRELPGADETSITKFMLFNCVDPLRILRITPKYDLPNKNPLKYLSHWMNMDMIQPSPQEERATNYLLGGISDDLGDEVLEFEL